jgi:hypothetical protein
MGNVAEHLRHWSKPDKFGKREARAHEFAEAASLLDRFRDALERIAIGAKPAARIAREALDR